MISRPINDYVYKCLNYNYSVYNIQTQSGTSRLETEVMYTFYTRMNKNKNRREFSSVFGHIILYLFSSTVLRRYFFFIV